MSKVNLPIDVSGADLRLKSAIENHRQGHLERAEALYTVILRDNPDFADALNLLARLKLEKGVFDEGLALVGRALEIAPYVADFHLTAGVLLGRMRRTDDAFEQLELAGKLDPGSGQSEFQMGLLLENQQDWQGALARYDRALAREPNFTDALNNRGVTLRHLGRIDEAEAAFRQALDIDPTHVQALTNLSLLLTDFGDLSEAEARARHATAVDPGSVEAWTNLGTALYAQGRALDAVVPLKKALTLDDGCIEAHANLGMTLLALGDLENGWPEYEWRWKRDDMLRYHREFGVPQWTGEPLGGRSVLVHAEQGAGDTLQGLRYIAMIKSAGGRVVMDVQPPLVAFLKDWPDIDAVVQRGDPLPPVDFHAPVMSLPYLFGTTLDTIPANPEHLAPSEDLVALWKGRLPRASGLRVGLCWQGNPEFVWDRWRSIPLANFAPVLEIENCAFVSVHKGQGEGQIDRLDRAGALFNPSAQITSFADTAAIMENLDLVITSCTSVAHLAGVLGRPVWVVLNAAPDWRWLRDRDDTPWYPTMRLFRQDQLGDWSGVLNRVAAQLDALRPH